MKVAFLLMSLVAIVTSACIDEDVKAWCPGYKEFCKSNIYVRMYCKKTCETCKYVGGNTGNNHGQCGRSVIAQSRVIGGKDARPGSWPWQIGMFRDGIIFDCGGSLVNPKWIVTAAHCVYGRNPSSYVIVLGDHDLGKLEESEQPFMASRFIPHPNYNPEYGYNNDIALIELEQPAMLNERIQPICLPSKGEAPAVGSKCIITGWGKITFPGNTHQILQQLKLGVLENDECNRLNGKYLKITDKMLCGSNGRKSRQSGCHGDSGGPFVCQQSDGSYKLHGAVSWGSPRCDSSDSHTVFARVAEFRDWIDEYINN